MTTIYVSDKDKLPPLREAGFYPTELTLINAALREFIPIWGNIDSILDIGAGDGRWGKIASVVYMPKYVVGVDIRNLPKPQKFTDWHPRTDFLEWQPEQKIDLILSNPPYHIAEEIIRHAWPMLARGGTMMMLLRLSFQAGVTRGEELWQEIPPSFVAVCSRRPSFYGRGTNGTDYGVFVWERSLDGSNMGTPGKWMTSLLLHERERKL